MATTQMPPGVHPTANIADGAKLGEDVRIGPGSVVGPDVRLGDGCYLHAYSVIEGDTELGPGCEVFPFAVLGTSPQDKKLRPGYTGRLRIGANNQIREHVTVHGGTHLGRGETTIGNGNMLLAGSHLGHDAQIGDRVVLTNSAMVAGHCVIEDHAVLGAMVGVHQFARVGALAMVGAGSMVSRDVPPFALVQGDRARLVGINKVGLVRAGFDADTIALIRRTFRLLFWRSGTLEKRLAATRAAVGDDPNVERILEFVAASERGICAPRGGMDDETARVGT
jgi:UDP-N-acetylglucosamine acyltransferase